MTDRESVYRRIEENRGAMIALQRDLVATPAMAPESGGDGEAKKAQVLIDRLGELGINRIEALDAPDERVSSGKRPNVLAAVPGRHSERSFWVMTHLDVVPPGDETLWSSPPFEMVEREGRLYGRGVEDNQQSMVASVFAAASILQAGLTPSLNVKLLFVADEEVGSAKGIRHLLEHHDLFGRRDLILVPDFGNASGTTIEVAEKNVLWLKLRTTGRQCHASTPEKGVNAFVAGSELALKMNSLNEIFDERDDLFDPPVSTFSPTKKEANIPNVNTIPAEDVFYVDCRILPSVPLEDVMSRVDAFIEEVSRKHGVSIEKTVVNQSQSKPTPKDTPLVGLLKDAVRDVYGARARVVGIGGGTVAAYVRNAGCDAVVWSRIEETAHMPNESCVVENMIGDAKVMAAVMLAD